MGGGVPLRRVSYSRIQKTKGGVLMFFWVSKKSYGGGGFNLKASPINARFEARHSSFCGIDND